MRRSTSFFDADKTRFMILSKRSNAVSPPGSSPGGITSVDCFDLLIHLFRTPRPCRRFSGLGGQFCLARQVFVGKASPSDARQNRCESTRIIALAFIVTKRLLVQVAEQMKRFDADVSAFQPALQQAPEILKAVRMDAPVYVLLPWSTKP